MLYLARINVIRINAFFYGVGSDVNLPFLELNIYFQCVEQFLTHWPACDQVNIVVGFTLVGINNTFVFHQTNPTSTRRPWRPSI